MASHIEIRFARLSEVDRVMLFIKNYWSETHILANDEAYMRYQHVRGNNFSYVVAEDMHSSNLCGILGYIPSNYGPSPDIWTVMWKVIKGSDPMLGIKLLQFLRDCGKFATISSCGINSKTVPIYQYLGYETGTLNHYYRLADRAEYAIADVQHKSILRRMSTGRALVPITDEAQAAGCIRHAAQYKQCPHKDAEYIIHRYFRHPRYSYKLFGVVGTDSLATSLLVIREQQYGDTIVGRIVDFVGDMQAFGQIGVALQKLLDQNDYEYMDCYCYGISSECMEQAGFVRRTEEDRNIIPNYYEPFVQKNVEIKFFTSDVTNFTAFKGDGDQDRPSFPIGGRIQ